MSIQSISTNVNICINGYTYYDNALVAEVDTDLPVTS